MPTDGEWQFVLDANDPTKPTLTIQPTPNYTCYKNGDKACDLRMYQVMVESFVNGDDTINYDVGYGPSQHKGDLQGIINSLDYIKSLNVNAIWLTPVFDSCADSVTDKKLAATGYFACDYFNVDPKFGTKAKLKELVDAAHAKGLYVFLDGVFGHTITDAIPAAPLSKVSPVMKKAGTGYTVDYTQANSVTFFKEVATHYVTEYGIDGWRLDQAYQVPPAVWSEIRAAVEAASAARKGAGETWGTLGHMVGEVWKGAGEISTEAYGPANAPALKSAFDFPLRYGVVHALAVGEWMDGGDATHLNTSWNSIDNYPMHAMPNLMISNHDLVRFGDLLERSGLVSGVNDPAYWLRNKAAFSFMAANSGPITLYYGDEIGDEVPGFSTRERDPSNGVCVVGTQCRDDDNIARSDAKIAGLNGFVPSAAQADLKAYVAKLLQVRAANPALYGGKRINLAKSATLYVDLKQTVNEQVVYLLNTGTTDTTYDLSTAGLKGTALLDLMSDTTITDLRAVPAPALTGRLLKVVSP
ncbi:MAG: alpha-amylase family protein [Aeromonadaceae bacterium]